jgi:hypothetical protein
VDKQWCSVLMCELVQVAPQVIRMDMHLHPFYRLTLLLFDNTPKRNITSLLTTEPLAFLRIAPKNTLEQ